MTRSTGKEGIWFYVRFADGWDLRFFAGDDPRWPDGPAHPDCWPEVARELSDAWSAKRGVPADVLYEPILECPYAFPRGRVSRTESGQLVCYYGEESIIDAKVRKRIEEFFAGSRRLTWKPDDHEHCLVFDRDEVAGVLGLPADWEASG